MSATFILFSITTQDKHTWYEKAFTFFYILYVVIFHMNMRCC